MPLYHPWRNIPGGLNNRIIPAFTGGPGFRPSVKSPGLKREAGANPAWSRHCNWQEPPLIRQAEKRHWPQCNGPGRPRGVRQQPEARRPAWELDAIRFAARCISLLTSSKPDRERQAFFFAHPPILQPVQDERNRSIAAKLSCPMAGVIGLIRERRPGGPARQLDGAVPPPLRWPAGAA